MIQTAARVFGLVLVLFRLTPLSSASAAPQLDAACTFYVDNSTGSNGDGSLARPWTTISGHLNLTPGQVLCIRGDASGTGRVYPSARLELNASGMPGALLGLRAYPGEKVVLRSTGDGPVLILNGDYWVVQGLRVDNNASTWRAIIVETGAAHNTLRQNEIYNGQNNGVDLRRGSLDNVVEDNQIYDFSRPALDAHTLQISPEADRNIVRRNTIHDCSGDGIQIIPPSPETNLAEAADGVQILDNVFYRGTLVRAENAIDIKAATNLTIARNDMSGYSESSAILLQKASRNLVFDSNIIHSSLRGINLHEENGGWPEGITVRNNMLYDLDDYAIQILGVRNGTFVHNTIVGAQGDAFHISGGGLIDGSIRNNLVVSSGRSNVTPGTTFQGVVVGPNGWFDASADFGGAGDVTSGGDPHFVDGPGHDYHLQADSPARDAGVDVGVFTDFEGDPRPDGSRPDLGADEYWPALRLVARAQNHAIRLTWVARDVPNVASYAIYYVASPGTSLADQGPSPILNVSAGAQAYVLTGLTNYRFYAVTLIARDSGGADIVASNSVNVMPTDRFLYLPLIRRSN